MIKIMFTKFTPAIHKKISPISSCSMDSEGLLSLISALSSISKNITKFMLWILLELAFPLWEITLRNSHMKRPSTILLMQSNNGGKLSELKNLLLSDTVSEATSHHFTVKNSQAMYED
jgi:hypothetical protein